MSQRVERTWICTGGYGRFRGEWVNRVKQALIFYNGSCLNISISATVSIELKETFLPYFPAEKPINLESNLCSCTFEVAVFACIDLHRPDSARHVSFHSFNSFLICFNLQAEENFKRIKMNQTKSCVPEGVTKWTIHGLWY